MPNGDVATAMGVSFGLVGLLGGEFRMRNLGPCDISAMALLRT
jgi:hypothetical protein